MKLRYALSCAAALAWAWAGADLPTAVAAKASQEGDPRVMQGPMVGAVTPHDAHIWVRLSGEYSVAVEYGTDVPGVFFSYSYGAVDFLFDPEPRIVYHLYDVQGRDAWEPVEILASELVNGVESWPGKVDKDEAARQKNHDAGRGYYEGPPE